MTTKIIFTDGTDPVTLNGTLIKPACWPNPLELKYEVHEVTDKGEYAFVNEYKEFEVRTRVGNVLLNDANPSVTGEEVGIPKIETVSFFRAEAKG